MQPPIETALVSAIATLMRSFEALYPFKGRPRRRRHDGNRGTGLTHHPSQNRSLRRRRWLILSGRGLRFPFPLLPKGQLPQLPRPPSMLAGIGRPTGMAEPLLHRGRLLVALDHPLMGGQLRRLDGVSLP
jgi:hypothetical protein